MKMNNLCSTLCIYLLKRTHFLYTLYAYITLYNFPNQTHTHSTFHTDISQLEYFNSRASSSDNCNIFSSFLFAIIIFIFILFFRSLSTAVCVRISSPQSCSAITFGA